MITQIKIVVFSVMVGGLLVYGGFRYVGRLKAENRALKEGLAKERLATKIFEQQLSFKKEVIEHAKTRIDSLHIVDWSDEYLDSVLFADIRADSLR